VVGRASRGGQGGQVEGRARGKRERGSEGLRETLF